MFPHPQQEDKEQVIFWTRWDIQWENVSVQRTKTQQIVIKMQPDLCPEKTSILYQLFPLSEELPGAHNASAVLRCGEAQQTAGWASLNEKQQVWNWGEGEGRDERRKQITGCGQSYTHYIERTWKALSKVPTSVQCIYKDSNKSHWAEQPEGALRLCNLMALCSLKSKSSAGFGGVPGQAPHGSQD